jgi:hypothetical protein
MSVTDPRYKLVSFRLSAAEYAEVEDVSHAQGYRSLSSFARSAALAFTLSPKSVLGDSDDQDLRLRVSRLASEVKRLSERLGVEDMRAADVGPCDVGDGEVE